MVKQLIQQTCEACSAGAPTLSEQELADALTQLPEWRVVKTASISLLEKAFSFSNFIEAVHFANAVAKIAEEVNHHPTLVVEWGRVKVQWWTHKIGGIHRNDAIMAAKTDRLFSN